MSEEKYYFVRFNFYAAPSTYETYETSTVIDMHPFDWIKQQNEDSKIDYTGGINYGSPTYTLLDYKEITKEEYDKLVN